MLNISNLPGIDKQSEREKRGEQVNGPPPIRALIRRRSCEDTSFPVTTTSVCTTWQYDEPRGAGEQHGKLLKPKIKSGSRCLKHPESSINVKHAPPPPLSLFRDYAFESSAVSPRTREKSDTFYYFGVVKTKAQLPVRRNSQLFPETRRIHLSLESCGCCGCEKCIVGSDEPCVQNAKGADFPFDSFNASRLDGPYTGNPMRPLAQEAQ